MAKHLGSLNSQTLKLRRTLREIVTPEEYEAVVRELLEMALGDKDRRVQLAAIKLICEYYEGQPPQRIEHTLQSAGLTIKDILNKE